MIDGKMTKGSEEGTGGAAMAKTTRCAIASALLLVSQRARLYSRPHLRHNDRLLGLHDDTSTFSFTTQQLRIVGLDAHEFRAGEGDALGW